MITTEQVGYGLLFIVATVALLGIARAVYFFIVGG